MESFDKAHSDSKAELYHKSAHSFDFKDLNRVESGHIRHPINTKTATLTWKNVNVVSKKKPNIFTRCTKKSYEIRREKVIINNGLFFLIWINISF
jgi:hypothetical protein